MLVVKDSVPGVLLLYIFHSEHVRAMVTAMFTQACHSELVNVASLATHQIHAETTGGTMQVLRKGSLNSIEIIKALLQVLHERLWESEKALQYIVLYYSLLIESTSHMNARILVQH